MSDTTLSWIWFALLLLLFVLLLAWPVWYAKKGTDCGVTLPPGRYEIRPIDQIKKNSRK